MKSQDDLDIDEEIQDQRDNPSEEPLVTFYDEPGKPVETKDQTTEMHNKSFKKGAGPRNYSVE